MKKNWRWPAAGAIGLLVAVSLFVIPAFGEVTVAGEVGTLRLHMASDGDRLVYEVADVIVDEQELSQTGCKLEPISAPNATLMTFSASNTPGSKTPFPGLKDHRIGVGQNGEGNGEPCARINNDLGQSLTLQLGGALDGLGIAYAEIDLGFKFNGNATLELKKGATHVGTFNVDCSSASDCGPDSGGSDNKRVIVFVDPANNPETIPDEDNWEEFQAAAVFDTIIIRPDTSSGVVSLEAGFNGSPPGPSEFTDTIFKLVEAFDGEIECEETEPQLGEGDATLDITRGNDTNGGCKGPVEGLLFNFESGIDEGRLFVDFVTETVDADPTTVAQFLEVITWTFVDPPDVTGGDPQVPTISYDDHVGAGERDMPWCLKDPRVGGSLPAPVNTSTILPPSGDPAHPHTSCLIDSHSFVTSDGDFVKVDVVYNIGDGKRWN
jgi:hypothetical protein